MPPQPQPLLPPVPVVCTKPLFHYKMDPSVLWAEGFFCRFYMVDPILLSVEWQEKPIENPFDKVGGNFFALSGILNQDLCIQPERSSL